MKKYLLFCLFTAMSTGLRAQVKDTVKLYNPAADAEADVRAAVKQAAIGHKNVLLQIGGNWCIWCLRFNKLVTGDPDLNRYMTDNYVVLHVNYSNENKNTALLARLGYPQRFGFPVFVVLDDHGTRLHTQNSAYLEQGDGHSKAKVMEFLKGWSPAAINPQTYIKN